MANCKIRLEIYKKILKVVYNNARMRILEKGRNTVGTINYHLDLVRKQKNGDVDIQGWTFEEAVSYPVEITVVDAKGQKVNLSTYKAPDLVALFGIKKDLPARFAITIKQPVSNSFSLAFKGQSKIIEVPINLKKFKRKNQLERNKIYRFYRYFLNNGFRKTAQRIRLTLLDEKTMYRYWLKHVEPKILQDIYQNLEKEAAVKFGIVIEPGYGERRESEESVNKQIYRNYEILSDSSSKRDVDYLLFLQEGDLLPDYALSIFAKKIIKHNNPKIVYADNDQLSKRGRRVNPNFKPDYAPDYLLNTNYIGNSVVYNSKFLDNLLCQGSMDRILQAGQQAGQGSIIHIDSLLYHQFEKNVEAPDSEISSIKKMLLRRNLTGIVEVGAVAGIYNVRINVEKEELVSIIIPTRNGYDYLKQCLDSVIEKTTYSNYEIIVADNDSTDPKLKNLYLDYSAKLAGRFVVKNIDIPFNYSKINNLAAKHAKGKYLLFLNNDTLVVSSEWLTRMVSYAQQERIGCVGAKMYYPDDTIQHAGIIFGYSDVAGCGHHYFKKNSVGYQNRLAVDANYIAVTAACLLVKRVDFEAVAGFDEEFAVSFNDVDLCAKIYDLGKTNVCCHLAELIHFESKSRGYELTPERIERFGEEKEILRRKWREYIDKDPCYNKNLTLMDASFKLKIEEVSLQS